MTRGDHSWWELWKPMVAGHDGESLQHETGIEVIVMVDLEEDHRPPVKSIGSPLPLNTGMHSVFFRETKPVGWNQIGERRVMVELPRAGRDGCPVL